MGAAAVELAIVLPILLTLVFGIIDFGFIFATQISLNSSARDAARAGVVKPLGGSAQACDTIAEAARTGAETIGLTYTDAIAVTVKSGTSTACVWATGDSTTTSPNNKQLCAATNNNGQLVVELTYKVVSPVPLPFSSPTLKATGAFKCEYEDE